MKEPIERSYSPDTFKPETILLSTILLHDSLFFNEDLLTELNGVTLRQALYIALGEVSSHACRHWSFASKVQRVMALRYGLLGGKLHTLKEVGQSFDMTRQGIFYIERTAIQYLKQPRWRKVLMSYLKTPEIHLIPKKQVRRQPPIGKKLARERWLLANPIYGPMRPILRKDMPANWIVVLRKGRKLKQPEFARLIGVSVGTVQRWEAGRHKPRADKVLAIKALELLA